MDNIYAILQRNLQAKGLKIQANTAQMNYDISALIHEIIPAIQGMYEVSTVSDDGLLTIHAHNSIALQELQICKEAIVQSIETAYPNILVSVTVLRK